MASEKTWLGLVDLETPLTRLPPDMVTHSGDVSPSLNEDVYFHLSGLGERVRLGSSAPYTSTYTSILQNLQRHARPVYVEGSVGEQDVLEVNRLLVPRAVRVRAISPSGSDVDSDVLLQPSHIRHSLKRTNPHYDRFYDSLSKARQENSWVVVTESEDSSEIVHVRALTPPIQRFGASCKLEPLPTIMKTEDEILNVVDVIPEAKTKELFEQMHERACSASPSEECIPFMYAADGCEARAHEMCERMLIASNVRAAKIWHYPKPNAVKLAPARGSVPRCDLLWDYHVAPVVRTSADGQQEWRVIDPALFAVGEDPPSITQWIERQKAPDTEYVITEAALFDQPTRGDFQQVNWDARFCYSPDALVEYRELLQLQIYKFGRPPYRC